MTEKIPMILVGNEQGIGVDLNHSIRIIFEGEFTGEEKYEYTKGLFDLVLLHKKKDFYSPQEKFSGFTGLLNFVVANTPKNTASMISSMSPQLVEKILLSMDKEQFPIDILSEIENHFVKIINVV